MRGSLGRIWRRVEEWYARRQHVVLPGALFSEHESRLICDRWAPVLLIRLAGRCFGVVYRGHPAARRVATLLAISAIADMAEALLLRSKTNRGYVPARAARDLGETVLYGASSGNLVGPSISASALVVELAFRIGAPAGGLVAAHAVVAAVARRASNKPAELDQLVFLAVAAVGGLGIRRVERDRVSLVLARADIAQRDAARLNAESAGRMTVVYTRPDGPAATFPSYHEALYVTALVGCDRTSITGDSALGRVLANRRPDLVRGEAVYLSNAMRQWADVNRQAHTLASRQVSEVTFDAPDMARVVLTRQQMGSLVRACEREGLAGHVHVQAVDFGPVGDPVGLQLEGDCYGAHRTVRLTLPADRPTAWYRFGDAAPAGMLVGALWAAAQVTRSADAVPVRAALPGAVSFIVATVASQAMTRSMSLTDAHRRVLDLSIVAAGVQLAGIAARTLSSTRPDGSPRLPVQNAVLCPSLLAGYVWRSLPRRTRVRQTTEAAALVAVGTLLLRAPRPWAVLAKNMLLAPGVALVAGALYRRAIDSDLRRVEQQLIEQTTAGFERAALEAEADEWQLLADAAEEAMELVSVGDDRLAAHTRATLTHVKSRCRFFANARRRIASRMAAVAVD